MAQVKGAPGCPGLVRQSRDCQLCRVVTFYVFILILAIESLILLPSAYNHRQEALQRLEVQAETFMSAALMPASGLAMPAQVKNALTRFKQTVPVVLAASVHKADGTVVARAGEPGYPNFTLDDIVSGRRERLSRLSAGGGSYDQAWRATLRDEDVVFAVRMDSSRVYSDLGAFVLRIAGLVAIIVLVVTAGTMVVLYRTVLSPVLRLRRSMLGAPADPDHADDHRIGERPVGEFGEVFHAYDEMMSRLAASRHADRRRAEEQAHFLARHDTLTGLPNRSFFLEHLRQLLGGEDRRPG